MPKNKCSLCHVVGHNKNHCPQNPQPNQHRIQARSVAPNRGGQFQGPAEDQTVDEDSDSNNENYDEEAGSDEEGRYLDPFVAEDRRLDAELRAPVAPEPDGDPFSDRNWLHFEVEPLRRTETRTGYSEESPFPESTYRYKGAQ